MGRTPCCEKVGLNKGSWTPAEDMRLVAYVQKHGHDNWRALPKKAGLLRCGKSCRLRWINYLRPDIKRGNFSKEEEETIVKLHGFLGNKWSKIASCLPGRTDNEIKNVWNTHLKKRLSSLDKSTEPVSASSSSSTSSFSEDKFSKETPGSKTETRDEAQETSTEKIEIPVDLNFDVDINLEELLDSEDSKSSSNQASEDSERKTWLTYLEKELDLWGSGENQESLEMAGVEVGSDPVSSYFQSGADSASPWELIDFTCFDTVP